MLGRHAFLVTGLVVAGSAPYLTSKEPLKVKTPGEATSNSQTVASDNVFQYAPSNTHAANASTSAWENRSHAGTGSNWNPPASGGLPNVIHTVGTARPPERDPHSTSAKLPPADGSKPIGFEEVFRLDVNSAWLMARWPRVSTGLAELDLHGYRVSLLTGKREDDLAGALTYYYDKEQVIQKMTFRGLTGDPRRLVHFCTTQYGFERETVSDPALQVYSNQGSGRRASKLTIRPASVIRADAPRERFDVDLVLYR